MLLPKPQPCQWVLIQRHPQRSSWTQDCNLQPELLPTHTKPDFYLWGVSASLGRGTHRIYVIASQPPNLCVVPTKAISSQNREDPTDMGSHLTPSSPLTCSTLEKEEEEGDEQVQDLHG